ncbi:MAG: hypothetical protein ABJE95_04185 [Byssovorax sp.]
MATTARDWSDPFLEQAREDLKAAWVIPPDVSPSTLCMLLQMVFEKLAKAAYARSGYAVPHTHQAATHLFAVLLRHPAGTAILQAAPNVRQFVMELEAAQPTVAGRQPQPCPQLEYPWEDPVRSTVNYPARDLPLARRVQSPYDRIAVDCLKFASAVEKQLTTIVP